MKEAAFWDSSALIPLCIDQPATPVAKKFSHEYEPVIWWATPVEIRSSFARLWRMKEINESGLVTAHRCLVELESEWREIDPSPSLRDLAEEFPNRYGLRAADALQLAAASIWTMRRPANRPFLSGDHKLLEAARNMGFQAIEI